MNMKIHGLQSGTAEMRKRNYLHSGIILFLLVSCNQALPVEPVNPQLPSPAITVVTDQLSPALTPKTMSATPLPSDPPPIQDNSINQPELSQLTTGGCCVQPSWSPDGKKVLFIDRPSPDSPAGLWGVDLLGNPPRFVSDKLGIYSPAMDKRAYLQNGATLIEELASGKSWRIPNNGTSVSFSLDGEWLAWNSGSGGPPFDSPNRGVWVSLYDGSQARSVYSAPAASFAGWFPDGRILVSSRMITSEYEQALWQLDFAEGEQIEISEIGRGGRVREAAISPDGRWVVYVSSFSLDPSQDGLWLVDTLSKSRRQLEVFGAYQWQDADHLLVVPLDYGQPSQRLLQVQASSGEIQALTGPSLTPFKISAGDWVVSPAGDKIVFVSATDYNLWLLKLDS